jgi:hypothetical protein
MQGNDDDQGTNQILDAQRLTLMAGAFRPDSSMVGRAHV